MTDYRYIGRNIPRADGPDKVRGRYNYLADEPPAGALHGAVVFSDRAHALVKAIDVEAALKLPGARVLTFKDAPAAKYNSGEWFPGQNDFPDETVLTVHARHVGDRLALVLAPDRRTVRAARDLVTAEYGDLPPVTGPDTVPEIAGTSAQDGQASLPAQLAYGHSPAA